MDQRIINLYDEYTHAPLSRAVFLKRLAALAGGTTAALAMLKKLELNYGTAQTVSEDDLFTERINYDGVKSSMQAYIARPKKEEKYAAVMVIHENRGLNAHIEDVARRVANAGYLAIAPNALSPLGGTPADEDEARELFTKLNAEDNLPNFLKGFDYVQTRNDYNGKNGCVGFCWGGAMANNLAVSLPTLNAAVSYYGRQPAIEDVPKIKSAIQLHYGGLDERINAGIPSYEKAIKENNIPFELYIYEGANHAFHNNTSKARYDEAAAKLSWERTQAFFKKYL